MIPTTRGIGTRYIQVFLDFLLLKKQAKYTFKRKEMASEILRMIIYTEAFSNEMATATPMPISLKEAYYELNWFKSQGQNVDSPCQMSITVR